MHKQDTEIRIHLDMLESFVGDETLIMLIGLSDVSNTSLSLLPLTELLEAIDDDLVTLDPAFEILWSTRGDFAIASPTGLLAGTGVRCGEIRRAARRGDLRKAGETFSSLSLDFLGLKFSPLLRLRLSVDPRFFFILVASVM